MEEVKAADGRIRVRFAPSPTGFLHVGGARTAVFNWLFAKNRKGKFLIRIEDTDPERSRSELSEQIIRSLKWLEMESDEPIVYQSDRLERYKDIVRTLVEQKKAYYAFETAEELESKRKESQSKKTAYKYDRASLKLDNETTEKYLQAGKEHTIRFFVPEGVTEFEDIVHGKTVFENSEIDDFIILRSDSSPVYQIAVVVDDYDMGITHVIRGDDHLSNTPKQILLYKALGWNVPEFAHLPMILDEQKKKLSKRRDTVAVEQYRDLGYLPDALFNFLTLLGFAPENKKEIISKEELIDTFTLDRVNKKSAVFDMNKLKWINSECIKSTDENIIAELLKEHLIRINIPNVENARLTNGQEYMHSLPYLLKVIRLMKERVSTINDFVDQGKYFFADPLSYDEKALAKFRNKETKELIEEYVKILAEPPLIPPLSKGGSEAGGSNFTASSLEEQLRSFAESKKVKASVLIHPLRLALTGTTVSPGIFELMEVLGKETVISRLKKFINQ
jgi:glutamyl-tRNA synthetase